MNTEGCLDRLELVSLDLMALSERRESGGRIRTEIEGSDAFKHLHRAARDLTRISKLGTHEKHQTHSQITVPYQEA